MSPSPPQGEAPGLALTLGFMARTTLQAVLADQEFRNYSVMLIEGHIAPTASLFGFGLLPNMNHKWIISSIRLGLLASWKGIALL